MNRHPVSGEPGAAAGPGIDWNVSLGALPFSPIRRMFNTAADMQDVVHLSIGQPDFPTPAHVVEAHVEALRTGKTRYALDAGLPELREAIARFYAECHDIELDASNVLITGCCQAMFMALTAALKPAHEVIMIEPVFVLWHIAEMAGATIRRVHTTAADGYQVDPGAVIDLMGPRTCAVMLNSPGNPTGTVYPRTTITSICEAAAERGITVISDEVYDRLILDDEPYASALTCAPGLDRLIVASSISKTYAAPGLRLGWAISSNRNIEALQRYHMFVSTCENTASQWAALAALTADQSCVDAMVAEYRRRRDRVVELVEHARPMTGYRPGGAFFIMPSLPESVDSMAFAMRLLQETGVCTIPGGTFGQSCNNALRISYSTSMSEIEAAFERMTPWLARQSY